MCSFLCQKKKKKNEREKVFDALKSLNSKKIKEKKRS